MQARATTFYVAVFVALALFSLGVGGFLWHRSAHNTPASSLIGEVITPEVLHSELHLPNRSRVMLIAVRSGCHFCEGERPFYQHLLTLASPDTKQALHFVTPDSRPLFSAFMPGAALEQVSTDVPLWAIGVQSTPTILLVDNGRVVRAWVGAISNTAAGDDVAHELLSIAKDVASTSSSRWTSREQTRPLTSGILCRVAVHHAPVLQLL